MDRRRWLQYERSQRAPERCLFSKLVGEIPKRIEEALLFSGGADFGEIHFVEREDADLDFRQRVQDEHELFLRWGAGAEFLAQLQQDDAPLAIGDFFRDASGFPRIF